MAFENITPKVEEIVRRSGVQEGLVLCNAMHITASVFINDDESGLHGDYQKWLEELAPFDASPQRYAHNRTGEDNADAHLKRQVMGREVVVAITDGQLDFGPWEQLRRYLQAVNVVRPVMLVLVSANVINAVANWLLVLGNAGFPELGVDGAAWATCISRTYMCGVLAVVARSKAASMTRPSSNVSNQLEFGRLQRLVGLGWPAAVQLTLEVGVFAAASALAGRLEPHVLAAHHIVLNLAGLSFMVPLGVASAGAVRVGHAVGRVDREGARRAGWVALALGAAFMSVAAALFVSIPVPILRVFTSDVDVMAIGVTLLLVAAVFQLFDGLQGVATGVLRGLGDTRTPMLSCLAGHWAIGLPVGYALCFWWGFGVVGLWIGLSTGLILVGIVLVPVWHRRVSAL